MVTTRSKAKTQGNEGKGGKGHKTLKEDKKKSAKVANDKPAERKTAGKAKESKQKPEKPKGKPVKKEKSTPVTTKADHKPIQKAEKTSKDPPKAPKEPSKPKKYAMYSDDQYKTFKKHIEDLDLNKLDALKDMLRKNLMKVSGTKPELTERIADAKVLGVIPKCPACGGGRPKLDPAKMTYHCSGYLEDVDFINCHKTFIYSEITRTPWQD